MTTPPRPPRRSVLDPAVSDLLTSMEQRQEKRSMSKAERKEAERQRARSRMMLDVPPEIQQRITTLAISESTPVSGLVTLAIARFLRDMENGMNLLPYKYPSRSPRFDWLIVLPENQDEL